MSSSSKSLDLSKSRDFSIFKGAGENFPKKGVINVYGRHGIGKTQYFSNFRHAVLDHDVLRSKEKTSDFMDMMKYSFLPLVLDDYELVESLPGIKELRALKIAPFYVISHEPIQSLDILTEKYEFPGVPVEVFASANKITVEYARELLEKYDGNMTPASIDLKNNFSSNERDIFVNSKEYVTTLFTRECDISSLIDKHLAEHGNTMGMVHENYPDHLSSLESVCAVSHSLSDADMIDRVIYSDVSWSLMHYFNVCACLIPSMNFETTKNTTDLRPASIWTKCSNMLMRRNRLKKLGVHRDYVPVLAMKINSGLCDDDISSSYDLDSINQLSFTKIKSRVLTSLKKKCRK